MNKKDMTVHELEIKAASVKYELDKLNRAAYGMTLSLIHIFPASAHAV